MKHLATLVLISLVSLALALELPFGQVALKDDGGRLIGAGKSVDDNFDIDLLQGYNGFATMTVTGPDGAVISFEVMITEDDDILIISGGELVSLRDSFEPAGLKFEVWREDVDDISLVAVALIEAAVRQLEAEALALGVTAERFQAELSTLVWAAADLMEAGLSQDEALEVLRQAMRTDPSLREATTIVADKIDLKEAGLSAATIQAFLALKSDDFGIDHRTYLAEYSTLASALIDLVEAGIDEAMALAILKEAMLKDPSLEEVSTIVADVIDRQEGRDDDRHDDGRHDDNGDDNGDDSNDDDADEQDDDSGDDEGQDEDQDDDDNEGNDDN